MEAEKQSIFMYGSTCGISTCVYYWLVILSYVEE